MNQQEQGVTPEQFKLEQMKQNTARRFADYEDAIATLQTQLEMARQRIGQLEDDKGLDAKGSPEQPEMLPPPPPIEGA